MALPDMTLPKLEIDRRRPVWVALSDLYLDAELQPSDHDRIADVIIASGYTMEQVEQILRREVGPVVGVNLLSVAGEWGGFNEEWLVETILRRRRSWRRLLPGFADYGLFRGHWEAIRRSVAEKLRMSVRPVEGSGGESRN